MTTNRRAANFSSSLGLAVTVDRDRFPTTGPGFCNQCHLECPDAAQTVTITVRTGTQVGRAARAP